MPHLSRPFALALMVFSLPLAFACGKSASSGGTPDASLDDASEDATNTPDASDECVATNGGVEQCGDQLDNDCNGLVDDVDDDDDGLYDCLRIGILGNPGSFGASNFIAWLTSNGLSVTRTQTGTDEELTAEVIDDFDVVIIDRLTRTYTEEEADVLHGWVEAGGGVMSMTGYSGSASDTENPNSLLAPLNLAYSGGLVSGPVTSFTDHPTVNGLTSITFSGGFAVTAIDGDVASTVAVATLPNEASAAMVNQVGEGRVFAWGDEWVQFDSEWSSMPEVTQFWAGVTGWLGGYR